MASASEDREKWHAAEKLRQLDKFQNALADAIFPHINTMGDPGCLTAEDLARELHKAILIVTAVKHR